MDKNTIWAIVLSSIVLIGFLLLDSLVFMPMRQQRQIQQMEVEQSAQEAKELAQEQFSGLILSDDSDNQIQEKEYVIQTNKVKVVFTNKGGDIVSYQLLEHLDKNTDKGVEMADNITATNRAFSLSFGNSSSPTINEVFNVKQDDKVIIFYRDFETKNTSGTLSKFRLVKRYEFKDDDYVFNLGIEVSSLDNSFTGLDINGASYSLRTPPQIGPHYDKKDRYEVRQYLSLNGNKKQHPAFVSREYDKPWEWVGVAGKYFAVLVKPSDNATMSSLVRCSSEEVEGYQNSQVIVTRNAINSSSVTQDNYYIYIGPRREKELIKYNLADKNAWGLINVKFNQALYSSAFLSLPFVEVFLKWSLEKIYLLVKNWGVAIIVLTILIKLVLFPLNKSSAVGSLKMQELQPKMQALQEKYKNNQQKLAEETQKLYVEAGYNPASGCLPLVIQMFILFAMYSVFNNYFEFRGASFIPGWIDDLSMGESILSWEANIPLISTWTQNKLRLLPFIYLASQLLNGKITQYGGAGAGMTGQQATQMKFMMYGMPIMFFFILYNVPSGLLLYWTVSNIFQMGQQFIINKTMKQKRSEMSKNPKSIAAKNNKKLRNKK